MSHSRGLPQQGKHYIKEELMSTSKIRTFTPLDADTWDALVTNAVPDTGQWCVEMSNQQLGDILGCNRRVASQRAQRLMGFGMVRAVYSEKGGRPQPKVYFISDEWLGKAPEVGDYYEATS